MPISETPQYRLGGWTGNVTDGEGVDWIVTSEDGWSASPPVRPVQEDRQSADGSWAGPGLYSARVISLAGKALAPNRIAMLQAKERIKAAITARQRLQLTVDEAHMSRYAWVRLSDQIDITDWGAHAFDWTLVLVASDPRRYSTDSVSLSTTPPSTVLSGRTYDRAFPHEYAFDIGGSGRVYFDNLGDYDRTPAVITISGPIANPRVAHVQSGRSLGFDLTLGAGEFLRVDLLDRTVLLNGTASRGGSLTSDSAWFFLQPGTNEIQFRGVATAPATPPVMTVVAASAWT